MLRANASTDKFITKNKQFNEKCLLTTIIFFICGLLMKVILRSKYLLLSPTGQCHASPREFRYAWSFKQVKGQYLIWLAPIQKNKALN